MPFVTSRVIHVTTTKNPRPAYHICRQKDRRECVQGKMGFRMEVELIYCVELDFRENSIRHGHMLAYWNQSGTKERM